MARVNTSDWDAVFQKIWWCSSLAYSTDPIDEYTTKNITHGQRNGTASLLVFISHPTEGKPEWLLTYTHTDSIVVTHLSTKRTE